MGSDELQQPTAGVARAAGTRRTTSRGSLATPRESILSAATMLFSQEGFAGTTMRDIALAVGVLPGSLYAHIDRKETLLLEIVESGIDEYLAQLAPVVASTEAPERRLRGAIHAHARVVSASRERCLVVYHQWRHLGGVDRARVLEKRRRYEQAFSDIVEDGVRTEAFLADLDTKIAVRTILGALNWMPEWYGPRESTRAAEISDKIADTLLCGLSRPVVRAEV